MDDDQHGDEQGDGALAPRRRAEETRRALAALLALDRALGGVLRTTREPLLGQMRLAWWRESLARLDIAPPPPEPILTTIAAVMLSSGVTGAAIAVMVDGWEALLSYTLDRATLERYAVGRGRTLFAAAAAISGSGDTGVAAAAEGWALADLAANLSNDMEARLAASMADERWPIAFARPWPRALRPLGALALTASADLAGMAPGSPRRVARLLIHRLTGR